jgi:hypothetical protein
MRRIVERIGWCFVLGVLACNNDDCGNESSSHGYSTSERRSPTARHVIVS